jgi:hypothetical protein
MTLEEALADAFARLARGVTDRRSPCHTPTLATLAPDGAPSLRTLVLRGFDAEARSLRLHTDARSAKAAAIAADPRCALHCYDAAAAVQLRLSGTATLHRDDALAETAWTGSRASSRMCYAIEPGSGTPVEAPPAAPTDPDSGRPHFAAILLRFSRLEWLQLNHAGHRRACFGWAPDGRLSATWLVP